MRKIPLSLFVFPITAALIFGAAYLWQAWESGRAINSMRDVVRSADLDALLDRSAQDLAGTVDQAMRGISLSQGEGGREIWKLDAAYGTFRQENGRVDLHQLNIHYAFGDTGGEAAPEYVHATSEQGRVEHQNTLMTMEGNVFASLGNQTLAGPAATFRSDTRILEMPGGGVFTDLDLRGEGNTLRWNLSDNILEGENGVRIVWTPSPGPDAAQRTPSPDGDAR